MQIELPPVNTLYLTELLAADLRGQGLPVLVPVQLLDARRSPSAQLWERDYREPVAMPLQNEFAAAMKMVVDMPARSRRHTDFLRWISGEPEKDTRPSFLRDCHHNTSFLVKHPSLPKESFIHDNQIVVHVGDVVPARRILDDPMSFECRDPRMTEANLIESMARVVCSDWTDEDQPDSSVYREMPLVRRVDGSIIVPSVGHFVAAPSGNLVWKLQSCGLSQRISFLRAEGGVKCPWTGDVVGAYWRDVSYQLDMRHVTFNDGVQRPQVHKDWVRVPHDVWPTPGVVM